MKELEDILKVKKDIPTCRKTVIGLFLACGHVKEVMTCVLKPYDLSIEQFNVLRILRGQKGQALNLQDIQERMINKMSNTTRLVDKLIKKDLVQRFTCEKNRRKVEIFITEEGLKLLEVIDELINEAERKITSNLKEDEVIQLNTLLLKLMS